MSAEWSTIRTLIGLCGFRVSEDTPCRLPAPYRVIFEDCQVCQVLHALAECDGHGVCEEHAHWYRVPRVSRIDGNPIRLARIHSQPARTA